MNWIIAILVLMPALSHAQSAAPSWTPVTQKSGCSKSSPCWIKQEKSDENLRVVFVTTESRDVRTIQEVEIKNAKQPTALKYRVPDLAGILPGESFQFFTLDLNKDGFTDLALFAFSAARAGPLFYYFIYDSKKHQFVMSDDSIPELKPGAGPRFSPRAGEGVWILGADLKLKGE